MKTGSVIKAFFIIHILCAICLALENPIGNPTVPPSSYRSGLVKSPNPVVTTTGNLIVTGNVAGGKEFRGLVPYRSSTDFGTNLGSSDIGSFLRRSAPINTRTSQLSPQPYYLPSRTVYSPASSPIITYPAVRLNTGAGNFAAHGTVKTAQANGIINAPAVSPLNEYNLTRPLSYKPIELERIINYDLMLRYGRSDLIKGVDKIENEEGIKIKTNQQAQEENGNILLRSEPVKPMEQLKPLEPLKPGEVQQEIAKAEKAPSIYEKMLNEISSEKSPVVTEANKPQITEELQPGEIEDANVGGFRSSLSKIDTETAKAITEVHKTFAAQSKDRFNYYMKSAEEFLKQGKYYRAADAYTLASIYKPDDPLAYAGRSHALFASGEYMSSAYYLTMAINMFPQYVEFKIDLNAMIPDKDRLESRIADIKQWIDRTGSPELSFLLAYIYHQLGKDNEAAAAIDTAAEKLPDSKAVKTLKQAIENK